MGLNWTAWVQDKWVPDFWALGANRHRGKWEFGEMMGTMANGHLEIRKNWSKRALGVNGHLGQMGTGAYGHQANGERALEANGPHSKWGLGANGHLGKWTFGRKGEATPSSLKGYPKCPVSISPNVCIWALWQMDTWTFGGKGYLKCPNRVPQVPCAYFPQICQWTVGQMGI